MIFLGKFTVVVFFGSKVMCTHIRQPVAENWWIKNKVSFWKYFLNNFWFAVKQDGWKFYVRESMWLGWMIKSLQAKEGWGLFFPNFMFLWQRKTVDKQTMSERARGDMNTKITAKRIQSVREREREHWRPKKKNGAERSWIVCFSDEFVGFPTFLPSSNAPR